MCWNQKVNRKARRFQNLFSKKQYFRKCSAKLEITTKQDVSVKETLYSYHDTCVTIGHIQMIHNSILKEKESEGKNDF